MTTPTVRQRPQLAGRPRLLGPANCKGEAREGGKLIPFRRPAPVQRDDSTIGRDGFARSHRARGWSQAPSNLRDSVGRAPSEDDAGSGSTSLDRSPCSSRLDACRELAEQFVGELPRGPFFIRLSLTRPKGAAGRVVDDASALGAVSGVLGAWLLEDARRRPDGEHLYGVAVVRDKATAQAVRQAWLQQTGGAPGCSQWKPLTGTVEHANGSGSGRLVANLARVVLYATKPRADGQPRDFAREAVATGLLGRCWDEAVAVGRANRLVGAEHTCVRCGSAIQPGRRGQHRRYCGGRCRTSAWRTRSERGSVTSRRLHESRHASAPTRQETELRAVELIARAKPDCPTVEQLRRMMGTAGWSMSRDAARKLLRALGEDGFLKRSARGWAWVP